MIVPDWQDAFTHNLHCRCSLRATVIYDIAQDSDVDAVEENEAALSNQKNHDGGNDTQWHYFQVKNSDSTGEGDARTPLRLPFSNDSELAAVRCTFFVLQAVE